MKFIHIQPIILTTIKIKREYSLFLHLMYIKWYGFVTNIYKGGVRFFCYSTSISSILGSYKQDGLDTWNQASCWVGLFRYTIHK